MSRVVGNVLAKPVGKILEIYKGINLNMNCNKY